MLLPEPIPLIASKSQQETTQGGQMTSVYAGVPSMDMDNAPMVSPRSTKLHNNGHGWVCSYRRRFRILINLTLTNKWFFACKWIHTFLLLSLNVFCEKMCMYIWGGSLQKGLNTFWIEGESVQSAVFYGAYHNAPCRLHTFTLNSKCI